MRRVGIIGIENSHSNHFLRHLNEDQLFPGSQVTAILRGEDDRVEQLTARAPLDVVDRAEDLVDRVDAAIVCSRDGALHRAQAEPLLRAGVPVLIDKPLATNTADAEALVALSEETGVLLMSASAVRFAPEVAELAAAAETTGPFCSVAVTGPADPASLYSGLFFYGIHTVETAYQLLGGAAATDAAQRLDVHTDPGVITAVTSIGTTTVTLRFVTPDDQGQVPFHAEVVGRHGSLARDLTLGPDYNLPLLKQFIAAIDDERPTADRESLVAPITLTDEIRRRVAAAEQG